MGLKKTITQETFDGAVKENVADFGMPPEDALADAIKQFTTEGVDLGNIVTEATVTADGEVIHGVLTALDNLRKEIDNPSDTESLTRLAAEFQKECSVDIARRCLAGKHDAYSVLLKGIEKYTDEVQLLPVLKSLTALTTGQPDLLTQSGLDKLMQLLTERKHTTGVLSEVLKIVYNFSLKHEANRESFMEKSLPNVLVDMVESYKDNAAVIQTACNVIKVLTYDDDLRVPFGKAHDRAKTLVLDCGFTTRLLDLLPASQDNAATCCQLLGALTRLMVRNEFCEDVGKRNGQVAAISVLNKHIQNQLVIRNVLQFLTALIGNDAIKAKILNDETLPVLMSTVRTNETNSKVAESALSFLGTCCLRCPDNSRAVVKQGGAELIVRLMQLHPDQVQVQKQACLAVRNIVSRTRDLSPNFLEAGIEEYIKKAAKKFPNCTDESKSALRDLGCDVELKEIWTGEGKGIAQT